MKKPTYSPDRLQGMAAFRTDYEIPDDVATKLIDLVYNKLKPGHEEDFISGINDAVSIYAMCCEFDKAPSQSQIRDEIEYARKLSAELAEHIDNMHFYSESLIREQSRDDFSSFYETLFDYSLACEKAAQITQPLEGRKKNPMPQLVFAEEVAKALETHTTFKAASGADSKFPQLLDVLILNLGFIDKYHARGRAISLAREVCKALSEKSTK